MPLAPAGCAVSVTDAVQRLRTESISNLRSPGFLENELLPALGLNNENLHEFPRELYPYCGRGVQSWQYPNQFSKYLALLSYQNIDSYLEIGCRHGGTFVITVEYLRRFAPTVRATAVDIEPSPIMKAYIELAGPGSSYKIESSRSEAFASLVRDGGMWGLVLVDGDHSLEGCLMDFVAVKNHARIIALHDVLSDACPGVARVWNTIKSVHPQQRLFEFTEQYPEVAQRTGKRFLGMGVVRLL